MMFYLCIIQRFWSLLTICPCELGIRDTKESCSSTSYLYFYVYIHNEKLVPRFYDNRNDLNLAIVNFPFWVAPVYRVSPLC